MCALLAGTWAAAAGESSSDDTDAARARVQTDVLARLPNEFAAAHRFSRAMMPRLQRRIDFPVAEWQTDSDDGRFLSFVIKERERGEEEWKTKLRGCYYAKEDAVFVLSESGTYVAPDDHPELTRNLVEPEQAKARRASGDESATARCVPVDEDLTI